MIGIVDFGSKKIPYISSIVNKLGYEKQVIGWEEMDESKLKGCKALLLSGAPILLTEVDYQRYLTKFSFLKDCKIPVLGICFGHQLIGLLYGATVFKGKEVRTDTEVRILKQDSLFLGFTSKTIMAEDHTEGITLPQGFSCLAKSADYEVEAMKHHTKPLYGVQFHPEVSGKGGEQLLNNFLRLIER